MLARFCAMFCGHLPVQEFLPWCSSSMTEINWNWKCQVVVTGYCLINDIVRTNSSSWDYKISAGPLRAMVAVITLSKVVLDVTYRHNVMDSCNYNMNYRFIEGASVCATLFRRVLQLTWRATDSLRPRDSVPLYKSRARVQHAPKQVDIRDVNCSRSRTLTFISAEDSGEYQAAVEGTRKIKTTELTWQRLSSPRCGSLALFRQIC